MSRVLWLGVALAIGAALPIQAGVNAQLRQIVGGPLRAALASVLISSLALVVIVPWLGGQPMTLRQSAWWMWLGGVLGAAYVTGSLVLAPRLGATTLIASLVAGQLIAAVLMDHFGWVGYPIVPVAWPRLIGIALLLAGMVLIQRR